MGRKGQARRRNELKAVVPATLSRALKIAAITVCQSLPDQQAVGVDVETHGSFRMIYVLRPTGDASRTDRIDMPVQQQRFLPAACRNPARVSICRRAPSTA